MTKVAHRPDLLTFAVAAVAGAAGVYFLWTAWTMLPPARDRLAVFQVYPRDFSVEDARVGLGAGRGTISLDRLTVHTTSGPLRLSPPRGSAISTFATDASTSLLTVHANAASRMILEVSGHGRTYLAYAEAAANARNSAGMMGLFGVLLLGGAIWLPLRRRPPVEA